MGLSIANCETRVNQGVMAVAKKVASESTSPRELVEALIDKVYVSPGNRIEVLWRISDFA